MKKVKPTKQQMKVIKESWASFKELEDYFYEGVSLIEERMESNTGIDNIEFFKHWSEVGFIGVGTRDNSIALIPREKLEGKRGKKK